MTLESILERIAMAMEKQNTLTEQFLAARSLVNPETVEAQAGLAATDSTPDFNGNAKSGAPNPEPPTRYEDMTLDELKAEVAKRGHDFPPRTRAATMAAWLEENDKGGPCPKEEIEDENPKRPEEPQTEEAPEPAPAPTAEDVKAVITKAAKSIGQEATLNVMMDTCMASKFSEVPETSYADLIAALVEAVGSTQSATEESVTYTLQDVTRAAVEANKTLNDPKAIQDICEAVTGQRVVSKCPADKFGALIEALGVAAGKAGA